jgi:uncharacterized lipoprotein YddW (UPF0748 family)
MNYLFKNKRIGLFIWVLFFSIKTILLSQSPKREMRGVWIASVLNIDYPSVTTSSDGFLKDEWLRLLEKHKAIGINTLFVQIRPTADALYRSDIVPWSRYLTGQSGMGPANEFDPLEFMISTAHSAGFEFHAWLNPYRAAMDNQTPSMFAENHVMRTHPEWCFKYNKRYIMNPGLPEVRAHFSEVVAELVGKYDVDGVHFDDYFYPHKHDGEPIPDGGTYQQYGSGFASIEDWRRNNVDMMVSDISKLIKTIKPRVQFGISPPGVWRNNNRDPEGTETRAGLTCYDDMYADVRKWLREGWIDYVVPQIYWVIGFKVADFNTIVNWWSENSAGKPVYVGLAAYRVGAGSNREPAWSDRNEIGRQIRLSRSLRNIKGVVFFSSKNLINNPLGIADTLRNNYYSIPALPPQIIKDTSALACEPPELRDVTASNGEAFIRWKPRRALQQNQPFQYAVYRFENGQIDFINIKNILTLIPFDAKNLEYRDKNVEEEKSYTYAIRVVDCNNEEIPPEKIFEIGEKKKETILEISPKSTKFKKVKTTVKKKKKRRCGFFRRLFGGC